MKTLRLNEEAAIPILGFGTWQLEGDECYKSVLKALETGYTHIDTADGYGNHREVAKAIKESGLNRKELFLTTKVFREKLHGEEVLEAGDRFLDELQVDYIDLLLIHWPDRKIPFEETLKAMEQLKNRGIIKAIGVSNFNEHHLEDALKSGVQITNNQVELRPSFNQKELRDFCREKNMTVTSYSTIKAGADFDIPEIKELAGKYDKTKAQIILNWAAARDIIVIPRSTSPERIEENFHSLDFDIEEEDLVKIDSIPQRGRLSNPEWADFDY